MRTQHLPVRMPALASSIAGATLLTASATSAAHEYFLTKNATYQIVVGLHVEPAFTPDPNGLQFFANVEDPPGKGTYPNLDTKQGDIVKLQMVPIRLDTDRVDPTWTSDVATHTVEQFESSEFQRCTAKFDPLGIAKGCEDIGYVAPFTPPRKGAYGFHLIGEIKRHDHDGYRFPRQFFSYIMVCQAGSHDQGPRYPKTGIPTDKYSTVNGGWFSCVYNPGDTPPGHRPADAVSAEAPRRGRSGG
ncbi:MAG: hypothetical protein U1E83_01730 [Methylotetracoccus sp.]